MSASVKPNNAVPVLELRRAITSKIGWIACGLGLALVIAPLLDIVGVVVVNGVAAITPQLFTTTTRPPAMGLLNAIQGTVLITVFAMLIAVPIGVGAGIHLSEYGKNRLGSVIRFLSDVLTGTPSIVMGYFSYIVFVIGLGWGFSLGAAAITISILIIPYLARITELALQGVPTSMREAAYALGGSDSTVVFKVVLPAASSGVITGALLALSISVGETAPLIFTAGWSDSMWRGHLAHEPVAYLTNVIWSRTEQADAASHAQAFAAALLVMLVVLAINVGVRAVVRRTKFA